jgi:hypothetical protein
MEVYGGDVYLALKFSIGSKYLYWTMLGSSTPLTTSCTGYATEGAGRIVNSFITIFTHT